MNKPIYLGQLILDISNTLMYEFWYDYIKPKYGDNARLCYMDTDTFVMHIKIEDIYKDIADDVKRWFDTSNYDEADKGPLPTGENKKVIGMFKDQLGMNDHTEEKKAKDTKKYIVKRKITFKNYMDSLLIIIKFILKKLIRQRQVVIMVKEYKHLIKLQRFPMEQMHLKCVRVKCYQKINGVLLKLCQ